GLETLVLLDRDTMQPPAGLASATLLPPMAITKASDLARLVREHRITQVVDVSSIDTLDCARVCDELGAHLRCTSVEEWPGKGTMPTDDAIAPFLPDARPRLERASCLVGSGANPGIVNALVFAGLREFSRRTGVAASVAAL